MKAAKLKEKIRTICFTIRKEREKRNYTQQYMADSLKISQNAYSKLELGSTKITVARLFEIAFILGTTPSSFIERTDGSVE